MFIIQQCSEQNAPQRLPEPAGAILSRLVLAPAPDFTGIKIRMWYTRPVISSRWKPATVRANRRIVNG